MIYAFIITLILICVFLYDFVGIDLFKDLSYYILLIMLILIAGFRYKVGGDTYNYMLVYDILPNISELVAGASDVGFLKLQPFWLLLTAIARSINEDFLVLQIIHAIIVNVAIFYFIKTNTKYIFTSVFFYSVIYYPYFNFEIMRESLAVVTFLLSLKYYLSSRWFYYYILCFIAFMFHLSAIILFFLPLINNINIDLKKISLVFILGVIFNKFFSNFILSLLFDSRLVAAVQEYSEYTYSLWGLIYILLFLVLYPWLILKISKNVLNINSRYYELLNISLVVGASTTMYFIFFRFINYFTPLFVLLLGDILHAQYIKFRHHSFRGLLVFFTLALFLGIHCSRYFTIIKDYEPLTRWYSRWYPYHSVINKIDDPVRENLDY